MGEGREPECEGPYDFLIRSVLELHVPSYRCGNHPIADLVLWVGV